MAMRRRSAAERAAQAERLRSRPARGQILTAARELAGAKGYEALTVGELAGHAGVSRETFYTHFAGKRACLAEAAAPRLGEIEQMLRMAAEDGEQWAQPILAAVNEQLEQRFAAEDGPRARIVAAMVELAGDRGYAAVRLADIVKAAHISYPSFYRHFESKEQCCAAVGRELLAGIERRATAAAGPGDPGGRAAGLRAVAESLATSPRVARLVLLEAAGADLSPGARPGEAGAAPASLAELLLGILTAAPIDGQTAPDPVQARMLAGALVETMRMKLLAGRPAELPTAVDALIDALFEPATDSRSRPGGDASPHHRHSRRERRSPARARAPQPTAA